MRPGIPARGDPGGDDFQAARRAAVVLLPPHDACHHRLRHGHRTGRRYAPTSALGPPVARHTDRRLTPCALIACRRPDSYQALDRPQDKQSHQGEVRVLGLSAGC